MRDAFIKLRVGMTVLLFAFVLAGCGPAAQDQREERDPIFRRAQARKRVEDIDGAIELYNKAIERRPGLALAHLELGLLYDQYKDDNLRAIYHYERYQELRPDSEKKKIVDDLIRYAKIDYVASLPERPPELVNEIERLKKEVKTLQDLLNQQQEQKRAAAVAVTATTTTVQQASAPVPAEPAPAQSAAQSYVVQAGDTLSRIAIKVYNDPSKWETIYNANRSTLPSPQSIRVGQTLVIPKFRKKP